MWQRCPICNGSGKISISNSMISSAIYYENCSVCNGLKIISEITGLPPTYAKPLKLDNITLENLQNPKNPE